MKQKQQGKRKGFTLIELLVVIGILVVLATVVVLVLNPAEIFKQARDSRRITDLQTLQSAITFYVATVANPTLFNGDAVGGTGCQSVGGATVYDTSLSELTGIQGRVAGGPLDPGWIVNLDFTVDDDGTAVPGGAPIAIMPLDPRNIDADDDGTYTDGQADYFYSFICSNTSGNFKFAANMESVRYSALGTDDVETNTEDGGTDLEDADPESTEILYETGTCVGDDYDNDSLCDPA